MPTAPLTIAQAPTRYSGDEGRGVMIGHDASLDPDRGAPDIGVDRDALSERPQE